MTPNCIPWTKTHGFYALMGGFALDTTESGEAFLSEDLQRIALTVKGLLRIIAIDPTLIPNISKEELKDKSKASGLGKTFACIQAAWFCLQCIARTSQGLPISLLELNTIGHALCALLIYALWWDKPFDVEQPTVIKVRGEEMRTIVAHMYMSSGVSCKDGDGSPLPEFDSLEYSPGLKNPSISDDVPFPILINTSNPASRQTAEYTGFRIRVESRRFRKKATFQTKQAKWGKTPYRYHGLPLEIKLLSHDFIRWRLASLAIEKYKQQRPDKKDHNLLVSKPTNDPSISENLTWQWSFEIGLSVALTIYGAIHAAAWNYDFISSEEQFLWRASVVLLMSALVFIPGFLLLGVCYRGLDDLYRDAGHVSGPFSRFLLKFALLLGYFLIGGGMGILGSILLPYLAARFYIVIESVKDVFFLQPEIFKQPVWTKYIPHIT